MPSVKYSGPWSEASGYAQSNRNFIQSLCDAGVDVVTELQTYAKHNTDYGYQLELAKSRQNKHSNYQIKVLHITPNVYRNHKEVGKYHIGHLFWETTKMSKNWAWYLNEVREIWTGCEENAKTFRDMGFEGHILKFPQPVNTDRNDRTIKIANAEGFIFGSVFQWIERKNPKALLTAYWREFENEPNVTLVIKTYGLSFEKREIDKIYQDISKWKKELNLAQYPRTLIIDELLTDSEIHRFYESIDCFVTAHRFEGWGIPIAEALAHKKPTISTNLGGIHEWVSDQGMYKVGYKLVDVFNMGWAEQYTVPGNKWAEVDENELRQKMRYVFEHREEAKQCALRGYEDVKLKCNFKTVGEIMKTRLMELEEKLK